MESDNEVDNSDSTELDEQSLVQNTIIDKAKWSLLNKFFKDSIDQVKLLHIKSGKNEENIKLEEINMEMCHAVAIENEERYRNYYAQMVEMKDDDNNGLLALMKSSFKHKMRETKIL